MAAMHGLGRALIGLGLTVAPEQAARGWMGDVVDTPGGSVAVRALGVRDMSLGLGQWLAARGGRPIKPWLRYGALSDLVDAGATALVGPAQLGPMATATVGIAASSTVTSLLLSIAADS
jgi:hypothetical protein